MIEEIVAELEDLGWTAVDQSWDAVSYRVSYGGMQPAEDYGPTVREIWQIDLWIEERSTIHETQIAIRDATRKAYRAVSALMNDNVIFSEVDNPVSDYGGRGPTSSLVFETLEPTRSWK